MSNIPTYDPFGKTTIISNFKLYLSDICFQKIPCVIRYESFDSGCKYEGPSKRLRIDIDTTKLNRYELMELSSLFTRYSMDLAPLKFLKQRFGSTWNIELLDSNPNMSN